MQLDLLGLLPRLVEPVREEPPWARRASRLRSRGARLSDRGTEGRNPKARELQSFGTRQILELMNDEDAGVPAAVRTALPAIEKAVDAIVDAIAKGGHVLYIGAGTSGRLGVLDASEAPPTFGVEPDLFHGIIAGGDTALRSSIEGAEDDESAGGGDVAKARGRAASSSHFRGGRAPYVSVVSRR